ncbi:MAG: hypothetical protein WC841_04415 [Candidatus Shapirobacteria bacterium]|jgi:hypothetical protein
MKREIEGAPSLLELTRSYPDISVVRDRIGDIRVYQALPEGGARLVSVGLQRDDLHHERPPYVYISSRIIPQPEGEDGQNDQISFSVIPWEEGSVLIGSPMEGESKAGLLELVDIAKKGFKMLDAFLSTPVDNRDPDNLKFSDALQSTHEDDKRHASAAEESRRENPTVSTIGPEPHEKFEIMKSILSRPSLETPKG